MNQALIENLTSLLGPARVKKDEPLALHTYMKVGGPADILVQAESAQELGRIVLISIEHKIPYFVLGGGSNIVVSDQGIRGVVIKNRADAIQLAGIVGTNKTGSANVEQAKIKAESGTMTNQLVRYSIDQSLAGLQYFLGVPGTLGGAVYNNSHYQNQLIGEYIESIEIVDSKTGQIKTLTQSELKFAYDYSILHKTKDTVLSATFNLEVGDKQKLWNQATDFAKNRAATQPTSMPSSGCMFKNIDSEFAKQNNLPTTSAGYLIDQAGLKGTRVGQVEVSDIHANFMVNNGGATSSDVKELVAIVVDKIQKQFGVTLEPEVFFIGG